MSAIQGTTASKRIRTSLFRRPDGIAEGARWLFTWLALASLAFSLPVEFSVAAGNGMSLALALGSTLVLMGSWIYGLVAQRVPFVLDVVDAVAITAFALAGPVPAAVVSVLFACIWLRTLYGSLWRSLVRCSLYAVAMVGILLLWPLIPGHTFVPIHQAAVMMPTMFLTVIVASQLGLGMLSHDRAIRRDKALATAGSQLLGLTDAVVIRNLAWVTLAEICAASPGLRAIEVVRDGAIWRTEGGVGGFSSVPTTLPREIFDTSTDAPGAAILDPDRLNAAVGTQLVWDRIRLTEQKTEGWMLIGAPKKISPAALLSVRSLVIQVSLALRNSDVHHQLTVQAQYDSLTGLDNRASFTAKLSRFVAHRAYPDGLQVLFLDLDDFKDVNDVMGHRVGDMVLVEIAARLRTCLRPADVCARLGGDEFAVLLLGTSEAKAAEIARRVVDAIADPIAVGDRVVRIGASVGVATAAPTVDIEDLVHQADVAMYAAKANGKGRVQFFDPGLLQVDPPRLVFERQLAAAANEGQLVVHYQPIVSLTDLRCTGVEALVRWQHPDRGLLLPSEFIQIAERSGAIIAIGSFVLQQACADAAKWEDDSPGTPLTLHVNVSAVELDASDFIDNVLRCLADTGLPASRLVIELTETVILDSPEAIDRLRTLAGHGIKIAIDDFGTGYSSLATLRTLPVSVVKLDMSFVAGALSNPVDRSVIEAIVQLSTKLGIHTIAEGVERFEQQQLLAQVGTDSAQGFLYARALPREEFAAWLHRKLEGPAANGRLIALRRREIA